MTGGTRSDDETANFLHKSLLLTNRQVSSLHKACTNDVTSIKLSKTQLSQIIKSGRFLGRLLGPLMKNGWYL